MPWYGGIQQLRMCFSKTLNPSLRTIIQGGKNGYFAKAIDPFHKWLPIINSFVIIKISLTNLVFKLIIQKNFYSRTSLVRII